MTCNGWGESGTSFLGDCAMSWLALVVVVFLGLVLRRQCDDGIFAGMGYNFIGSMVGGVGTSLVVITFFGSTKWALMLGLLGLAVGGFGIGLIFDSGGGGGDYG